MRNVFTVFKNDFKALTKHFLAFLIILVVMLLPALYAWFNIYAFHDPYDNVDQLGIAVVCNDKDYMDDDGNVINIGNELVAELKAQDEFGYTFLDSADEAVNAVYAGEYYAAVVIDEDFTYNMYNFLDTDMFAPTISFYQNEKTNAIAVKVVEAASSQVKQIVNEKYISAVVETLFDRLNAFSDDVSNDNSIDLLKNALGKIKTNLSGYDDTVSQFIAANESLISTLNDTNGTLNYSIYLLGNERVNINKQISYIENTQSDLSLINAEVNKLLLELQDSVQQAIFKLDRLYQGSSEDTAETEAALAELEQEYQELIDYITHSGLTGADAEDALTSLNTVKTKISELRQKLGLDAQAAAAEVAQIIQIDYSDVTVPAVYSAMTGFDYSSITSDQTVGSLMTYMISDADKHLESAQTNISIAQATNSPAVRNSALGSAIEDLGIADIELGSVGDAFGALETATGSDTKASGNVEDAAANTGKIKDKIEGILNGDRDIDLVRDLQLISDGLGSMRVALTESVYPAVDTILEGVQDSLGDISSILLDLSNIIGKTEPIITELGNTFTAVNTALTQIEGLVSDYCGKIDDLIAFLDGDTDNELLERILDFFKLNPETIGEFLASPLTVTSKSVYEVDSYGTAMTPFYSMLAIWVGCIILNSILKADKPVELEGANQRQKFFGRYLTFFIISEIQTMVILLGDLLLFNMTCQHIGLFLLTGFVTSLACSMLAYSLAVALGNIGKFLVVVIMIIQIAGSGGSYPIELLPKFFEQIYLFFPFPYAINAMREAIAGMYQYDYCVYLLKLMIFFVVGLLIGLPLKRSMGGLNEYMNEQLDKTEIL